jgi:hypothetical protein
MMNPASVILLSFHCIPPLAGLLLIFLPVEEKLIITLLRSVRYSSVVNMLKQYSYM